MPNKKGWQIPGFFRGFNMSLWSDIDKREVNQQDFDDLKSIGANLVMIQTNGFLSEDAPYSPSIWRVNGTDTIYYSEMLDKAVDFARESGIHYVITVRTGPGRKDVSKETAESPSTIWTNEYEQQLYGSMLKTMVRRYYSDTLFVGLDINLEPNPLTHLAGKPVEELKNSLKKVKEERDLYFERLNNDG